MTSINPIHTASICGTAVRFFAAPTGRTEVPWHAVDDLYEALKLTSEGRRRMRAMTRSFPGAEIATIRTDEGPTLIASQNMAIGLIGAVAEAGMLPATFEAQYVAAGEAVLRAMHVGLDEAERTNALVAMAANTLGVNFVIQPAAPAVPS